MTARPAYALCCAERATTTPRRSRTVAMRSGPMPELSRISANFSSGQPTESANSTAPSRSNGTVTATTWRSIRRPKKTLETAAFPSRSERNSSSLRDTGTEGSGMPHGTPVLTTCRARLWSSRTIGTSSRRVSVAACAWNDSRSRFCRKCELASTISMFWVLTISRSMSAAISRTLCSAACSSCARSEAAHKLASHPAAISAGTKMRVAIAPT